ncbi:MAG: serine/threonine-protein kinase [Gaiellaceae bacterium]
MSETLIAGRYRLEELLGRGGMSEVWCATDTELGRTVAIKLLAPDADTARFEREAKAVASLGHPNITQLYDYGEENGRPYMVLEHLPGGTLEDRLREHGGKPLPDGETAAIAAGIAAGLAHAHARDVVHRDLKPANVLFDDEGRAKIADFGIARMAAGEGTLTEAGTVLGTAAYISPEQAGGLTASTASDVYSVGVMLFRMLTGRLPFESNNPMELVALHRDAEPPPVSKYRQDAPPVLESAATRSLAKRPGERPRDGAALLAALGGATATDLATGATASAATDGATQVMTVPPPPPAGRPAPRRSRVPLLVAGLAALVLAGVGVAYAITRPTHAAPPGATLPPLTFGSSSTGKTTTAKTATAKATTAKTTASNPTAAQPTTAPATTIVVTTQPATTRPLTIPVTTAPPPTTVTTAPTTTAPTTATTPTTAPTITGP